MTGHLAGLVCAGIGSATDHEGEEVHWISGSGSGRKRIRLNRKTPAHFVGRFMHSWPRVWKRLHLFKEEALQSAYDEGVSPVHPRTGVG